MTTNSSLRAKTLEDAVNEVQGLAAVATESQVRSVAQLLARCTLALADGMSELSGIGFTAKRQLVERLDILGAQLKAHEAAMTKASKEATEQTNTLLKWNKALVIATGIYTFLTFVLVLATILKK
jgi:hypothetical protein